MTTNHAFEIRHDHEEPASLERCFHCGEKESEHESCEIQLFDVVGAGAAAELRLYYQGRHASWEQRVAIPLLKNARYMIEGPFENYSSVRRGIAVSKEGRKYLVYYPVAAALSNSPTPGPGRAPAAWPRAT